MCEGGAGTGCTMVLVLGVTGRSRVGNLRAKGALLQVHSSAGTGLVVQLFMVFCFLVFFFFSCKRKGEKDEFLICKLISLISSN